MDIAKQIKQQAKQHGMTTQMLADKLGITRPVFSSQINGNPTIATLDKIANAIGCDVGDFFRSAENEQKITLICPHCNEKITLYTNKISEN